MHSKRCDTYKKQRDEVHDIMMAREAAGKGCAPMDVSALTFGNKGKKGKKGGKKEQSQTEGKTNHWQQNPNKQQNTQYQNPPGKDNPDKDKECFYCKKKGHIK